MRPAVPYVLALVLAALAACAAAPAARAPEPEAVSTARAVHLARVRCLLVAPFENASDDPLAADAAAGALLSAIDQNRTRVYPIQELRATFEHTSMALPDGISPSLAVELAEIIGADAVLYGAVEGRSTGAEPELMVTMRLTAAGARDVLFARVATVVPGAEEPLADAIRRTVREAAEPMLSRIGVPGRKICFDRQRTERLKLVAGGTERASAAPAPPITALIPPPPPVPPRATVPASPGAARVPAAATPAPRALAGRQAEWSKALAARERLLVADVAFAGRSAKLERDAGLADLAAVLAASPALRIRVEGFVDASSDPTDDLRISKEMACAAAKRLAELGVARERVTCTGRGREDPVLPNFTYRGRAANRRVEVVAE